MVSISPLVIETNVLSKYRFDTTGNSWDPGGRIIIIIKISFVLEQNDGLSTSILEFDLEVNLNYPNFVR